MKGKNNKKTKLRSKLTPQEIEQRNHVNEIKAVMKNLGYKRPQKIDGIEFVYKTRTGELDEIFIFENIILIVEATCSSSPCDHLKNKKIIFDLINENHSDFIKFLCDNQKFNKISDEIKNSKYTINQFQLRIIYASKETISSEIKGLLPNINYLDYNILKYFTGISRVIKKSARYEFFDFIKIPHDNVGDNILHASGASNEKFKGYILPEEHSCFKDGHKLISFYIDAESLLKRAYVLRKDGWREKKHIGFYQRMLTPSKIKSMRKYLKEENRVFVNNIVATLPIEQINLYDSNNDKIKIKDDGSIIDQTSTKVENIQIEIENKINIIGIIDGQHRTFAYHEGDDEYEKVISELRKKQTLLITGILFPKNYSKDQQTKFEAQLFLEINSNQQSATTKLKQEIEGEINPFSTTSIAQRIVEKLSESGPLSGFLEKFWYEKGKIRTSTIVSYGLKPLVKLDGNDSLYNVWDNKEKESLRQLVRTRKSTDNTNEDYKLLGDYIDFCVNEIRKIFIVFKNDLKQKWNISKKENNAILNVTFINGVINTLRKMIENSKKLEYKDGLKNIDSFDFRSYKTSRYRQMGEDIYNKFFKNV